MGFTEQEKAKFQTAMEVMQYQGANLGVLECTDRTTGKPVPVLVAQVKESNGIRMFPLAIMFQSDPFDFLEPPVVDGQAAEIQKAQGE